MGGLESWRDGATRAVIEDFVARVCDESGPDHVPASARVVVADNDGTLWCEKPMPVQLDFTVRRLGQLAAEDPSLRDQQPYKAAYEQDLHWMGAAMVEHYRGDDGDLNELMAAVPRAFDTVTIEEYDRQVSAFFADAVHPTMKRPYLACAFAPMVELFRYLEAHGFTVFIASGGDRDFMRAIAEDLYGVPPERVTGSALGLTYRAEEGRADLLYKAEMDFFDDGEEKPVRIWSRIGRRPILSIGNSNGDTAMMDFSAATDRPALRLLVLHDDAEREFSYTAGAEDVLARAREHAGRDRGQRGRDSQRGPADPQEGSGRLPVRLTVAASGSASPCRVRRPVNSALLPSWSRTVRPSPMASRTTVTLVDW